MSSDSVLVSTRQALHAVAEHVLAATRYAAVGRIGLVAAPSGFGTPPFGDDDRRIRVELDELVLEDRDGERREPISTLRRAGEFVGIEPAAPPVYHASTSLPLDTPLAIDPAAAAVIADWYALVDTALRRISAELEAPSGITLWPEHFDLALAAAEVNYGGSPGDVDHPEPYLYVGPFARPLPKAGEGFWNEPFGASLARSAVPDVDTAVTFFRQGRDAAG